MSGISTRPVVAAGLAWWRALASRERSLVSVAGIVLLTYLLWAIAVAPAWRTLARAPAESDALEARYQSMQRLADEARQLRATPPINPEQASAALQAATQRLGAQGRLVVQGERAVLTLSGVGTQALQAWLAEARSGARARPVEANLTRAAAGYNGSIVLVLGGAP